MNKSISNRYAVIVTLQYLLLFLDISVNSFSNFARESLTHLLILYIVQDFCIILSLTLLLVNFFSTYVFQVGLIQVLYVKFRYTIILSVVYLLLSISLHTWHIKAQSAHSLKYRWTTGFHILYSVHRIVAVVYYYYYKRASIMIADPKFYDPSFWIQNGMRLP